MWVWLALACAETTSLTSAIDADSRAVPPSVTATRTDRWDMELRWTGAAEKVAWTGSFTGWSAAGVPMTRGPDGIWRGTTRLDPGVWSYKLVVDGKWIPDPENPLTEDDGFQGRNSVLRLGREANLPSRGDADGAVELGGVDVAPVWRAEGGVRLRVRTLAGDATGVSIDPEGAPELPLERITSGTRDTWEGVAPLAPGTAYRIRVADGREPVSLPLTYQIPDPVAAVEGPSWSRGAVWYQIFPDRYANGDPTNDPPGTDPWAVDWYPRPGDTIWGRRMGGDFAGIGADLPRIRALGVDAIYLNPIWASPSPHHYDASTWVHVDPAFGAGEPVPVDDPLDPSTWTWTPSDRLFLDLVDRIHAAGMKVVIDGVFNHTGATHAAWMDVAKNGSGSPFARWYTVQSWDPPTPAGWGGHGDLPLLAHDDRGFLDPSVDAHISAVTRRWMDPDGDGDPSDGVDGWRLDVADELPAPFWARWRREVRAVNPDAVIVGEVWKDADPWLDGATFDGVTAYPWMAAVLAWAEGSIPPSELDRRLADVADGIPPEAALTSWTLVGSHDTDRLRSRLFNPGRGLDQRNRADIDPAWREERPDTEARARLVALIQATTPGSPLIWYGDEVGIWGGDDPHSRKPMPWPDQGPYPDGTVWDPTAEAAWTQAFQLRRRFPVLRTGSFRTLVATDEIWGFVRSDGHTDVLVLANATSRPATIHVDGEWERVLGDGAVGVVGPLSAQIWTR